MLCSRCVVYPNVRQFNNFLHGFTISLLSSGSFLVRIVLFMRIVRTTTAPNTEINESKWSLKWAICIDSEIYCDTQYIYNITRTNVHTLRIHMMCIRVRVQCVHVHVYRRASAKTHKQGEKKNEKKKKKERNIIVDLYYFICASIQKLG